MAVITLLTDFGLDDAYVGILKGVILTKAPTARIIDISHQIPPQGLVQAAYLLTTAFRYFPRGTIHTVIVDPGVGSSRSILAVQTTDYLFLAPDNGVLTMVLENTPPTRIVSVENQRFFLPDVSRTFHGRDIFAPVAAHLSRGVDIDDLGPPVSPHDLVRLAVPRPTPSETGGLTGTIIDIDRFGNLITNIDAAFITTRPAGPPTTAIRVIVGEHEISGLSEAYAAVPIGAALAVIGSRGYLEISINCGSAQHQFSAAIGDPVQVASEGPLLHLCR